MRIEVHVLQNFAPSNLNRDDTGSPKDAEFGGHRRARVSSQCLKRAVRGYFKSEKLIDAAHLAERTKRLAGEVAKRLVGKGRPGADALRAAKAEEAVKNLLDAGKAADLALFGRMLADLPDNNVDAACQVAHSISTNKIHSVEMDYYTAVDDLKPDDTAGADMIGTVEFNSACFYR